MTQFQRLRPWYQHTWRHTETSSAEFCLTNDVLYRFASQQSLLDKLQFVFIACPPTEYVGHRQTETKLQHHPGNGLRLTCII